jgi:1-acyl-sn-glycerol-3-phosphate acyltransferase
MIDTHEFRDQILTKHRYSTPEAVTRCAMDRMFGRFNFWYRWRVMGVVTSGGRLYRSGGWNRETWLDLSLDMWRGVEGCGGSFDVSGCENLAALDGRPAVIVANHMSLLETFTIPAMVLPFQDMTFVVKKSLTELPLFRDVMNGVRPISVGRKNPRDDLKTLMEEGPKVLAEGRSLVIFPQSTRSVAFKPSMFNSLGSKVAKRAGVPLMPLALKTDLHGIGRVIRDFGPVDRSKTVHFQLGPAMPVTGNGREEHEMCVRFIGDALRGWGGTVEGDQ